MKKKKYRDAHGRFVVEGVKMLGELIRSTYCIDQVYATDDLPEFPGLDAERIGERLMKKITCLASPSRVLALVKYKDEPAIDSRLHARSMFLALDRISDPGNMGSMIRLADWFGMDGIFCSDDTVDLYNPKVVQATMGSLFRIPVWHGDLKALLANMRGKCRILAATLDGDSLYRLSASSPMIVLLGNESRGIRDELLALSDAKIRIPGGGQAESLNVSMAAAVIVSEYYRQSISPRK